jgi:hypothetical protein
LSPADRHKAKSLTEREKYCDQTLTLGALRTYSGGEWEKVG